MSRSSLEVCVAAYFKQTPTTAHDKQHTTDCWLMDTTSVSFFLHIQHLFSQNFTHIIAHDHPFHHQTLANSDRNQLD